MAVSELSDVFLARVSRSRSQLAATDLEEELAARVAAGREGWPGIALPPAVFVEHLAAHATDGVLPPRDRAGDLWIACACANAIAGAAAAFERKYRSTIERAVWRVDRNAVDDVTQSVMVALLVPDAEGPPDIAKYGGRAALTTWLVTIAARQAGKPRKKLANQPYESLTGLARAVAFAEPELALAKARHAHDLDAALRTALDALDDRKRVILRMHHVQGMSIDKLAAFYKIGRSTAARWAVAAREALLTETKRALRERLQLTPTELESLVAALQSDLETSLVRLLGSA